MKLEDQVVSPKLAKQLKEAGFPQGLIGFKTTAKEYEGKQYPSVYIPTFSELIDACGKGRFQLERIESDWFAFLLGKRILQFGEGKTYYEAVARLWLKLYGTNNKPKTESKE